MSREGLIPQLLTRGTQVHRLKYSQQSVSVYQCTSNGFPSAVKVLSVTPGIDYTQLEKECQTLINLSHPNILKLYDCFWEHNGDSSFFLIITEWCEKDLAKDTKQRAAFTDRWEEKELWDLTFELVSALTYMQEQGISHRDIKPENIFLTSEKSAKLGDFGSARAFLSNIGAATLTDIPLYLSPKQKEAFAKSLPEVVHNSFKSDVFSLGVTLLSLTLLGPPLSLARVNITDEEVRAVISTLPYSYLFKSMLGWMLSVDEDKRCEFKTLNIWIEAQHTGHKAILNQVMCMHCEQPVDRFRNRAQCEVVQLYCEPTQHMFCSIECCKAYLCFGKFKCPLCDVEIPNETVIFYLTFQKPKPVQQKHLVGAASKQGECIEEKKNAEGIVSGLCEGVNIDPTAQGTTDNQEVRKIPISNLRRHRKDSASRASCCDEKCSCW